LRAAFTVATCAKAMSAAGQALGIERLEVADVPQNVALSRSVGWKDVEAEWRVLHAAADVRGVRQEGRLVAQGALGDYGTAATLAKMVVAEELRGRRLAARLLDGFLADAGARGIPIGLCATDHGRPLYTSRGFEVSGELMVLFGTASAPGTEHSGSVVPLVDVTGAIELDREFSRCDRARMLAARFAESSARLALADGRGFALATTQGEGTLVGPILADSEAGAKRLASALLAEIRGPVRVDVPLEHADFRAWLVELGLKEVSQRVEMTRGAARSPWQVPQRFVLSTQAFG
jgi:hypothetical protein